MLIYPMNTLKYDFKKISVEIKLKYEVLNILMLFFQMKDLGVLILATAVVFILILQHMSL